MIEVYYDYNFGSIRYKFMYGIYIKFKKKIVLLAGDTSDALL